ncbi:MAG TPA: nuclear transport factor 2 family protein [Saprospiraceae bacterium]|nr:nuclear transport factor 2 family protein [Saprospiraceae bacterium]HND89204.1 nuclear transport factor 2 family protein [Saprospiraceae bacterium]
MTTQQVADRFYALAQQGQYAQIQQELYAQDVRSVESSEDFLPNAQGLDKVRDKDRIFNEMVEEMHGGYCSQPIVAGKHFACTMGMDVTMKGQGRMQMDEIAVYEVEDGKIVLEQFFYA